MHRVHESGGAPQIAKPEAFCSIFRYSLSVDRMRPGYGLTHDLIRFEWVVAVQENADAGMA